MVNRVRAEVDPDANVIFGSTFDQAMEGRLRVSVVATGMDAPAMVQRAPMLEVIRGGIDKQAAAPEPAAPAEAADPVRPAPPIAPEVPQMPVAPPERRVSIDPGVYIPAAVPPSEPKRSYTLFERLTGAARRDQKDDG